MNTRTLRTPLLFSAILAALALSASPAAAQTSVPYFKNQFPQAYVPLTGGTGVMFQGGNDDGEAQIPLGFSFEFYGQMYTQVNVSTNGYIQLATPCTTTAQCGGGFGSTCTPAGACFESFLPLGAPNPSFPSTNNPQAIIAAVWDDLNLSSAGSVSYATQGTAPNREFVIEWLGVPHFPNTQSNVTYQIRLSEASGSVRLHYGTFAAVASENTSWSWSNGIENELGTIGEVGTLPCGTINACAGTDLTALNNTVIEWVGPAGVELVPGGTAPTGANPGDPIQIDVVARNVGTMTATAGFTAAVYFSTDASIETTDTLLGTVAFASGLASRTAVTQTLSTNTPTASPGFYTIGVILDSTNAVAEDIETNNTVALTTSFLVGADLAVEVDTPADSGPGETVQLTARVLNLGAAQAAVPLRLYLSLDPNLDPGDLRVVSATVAVAAQPSNEFVFPTVIPTITPGNYYLIAEVDAGNTIVEADETNNIAASATTTVLQGPDLVADDISSPAAFAFRGAPLEVAVAIENIGLATASGLFYGIYFSENSLCSAVSDPLLAQIGPVNIGPGEFLNATHMVDVPASINAVPHILCLIVNANGAVLESRQNNNIARTLTPIDVRDPQPDFTVTEIRLPERAAAGESVTVQRTLLNDGNAPGMAGYEVYLSEDTTLDMQDILLGSGTTTLDPAAEDVDIDTVFVPATVASGGYYVIYQVDPADAVPELFEDNNQLVSGGVLAILPSDLVIQTPTMPIGTLGVPYDVFLSAVGGSGGYMWSLAQGSLPAGLALDAGTGRVSGTPTEEGQFSLVVQVTDGALVAQRTYDLLISAPTDTLEVLTRALPPGFVNRAYEATLTAFGGVPPYTWSSTGINEVPPEFNLSVNGVLIGLPTDTTLVGLTLRVTDALGAFAERPMVLRVVQANDSVRLSNDILPDGRLGEIYDETVRVASGTGSSPFTYALAGGELPPGLSLDGDRIFGTPSRVGIFSFEIRVGDSRGDFDVNRYVVEVDEGEGVTFVTNALPGATVDAPYLDGEGAEVLIRAVSPAATGTITISVVAGEVPPGLAVSTDGRVLGTPTMQGTFSFTVRATDDLGQSDLRAYGVVVSPAPVDVGPPEVIADSGGCVCLDHDSDAPAWGLALLLGAVVLVRRRRRGLLGLFGALVVLGSPLSAEAQSGVPYFQDTRTETYVERSSCQAVTFRFGNDDSDAQITLPFPFRYFGQDQTSVSLGTNGYARFDGSANSLSNTPMPNPSSSGLIIAPWWDDLITGSACTALEGTAPNRVFILQWTQVTRFGSTPGSPKFQIWLYEGPGGRFEVRYGPSAGVTNGGWTASAGYDGPSGSDGGEFLTCTSPGCDGAVLASAENTVVRVQADAGPDLSAAGIDVPPIVYAGVSFPTTAVIQSLHQNALGPVRYAVHVLGPNETVPNNQIYLSPAVTVQPYQALTVTPQPTVPLTLPSGRYRLALVVDPLAELTEPDESNNVFISTDTFRLAQPQPDFVVDGITPSMPSVEPGATFSVTMGLRNRGNLDGVADWRLVLSRNQVVSPEDLELDAGTESLPLVTTSSVTVQVTLPASVGAGQYYLGVVMDPDNVAQEIDEVNNFGISADPLSVASDVVTVDTSALPGGYVGIEYTHFLRARGGDGAYTWSVDSGSLPAGISLVPSTGELRGRPNMAESANVTVRVESAGQSATQALTLEVIEPDAGLSIVTRSLLPGLIGQAYPPSDPGMPDAEPQRIRVVGATGEVTFSLEGEAPGLELTPDGILQGTPSRTGTFTFDVTAEDDATRVTKSLTLFVGEPGILTLVASELPEARLGIDYIFDLRVVGQSSTATVTFTQNGPLPPGIVVTSDGRVLGNPEQVGVFAFSVTASEGMGQDAASDSATFRLTVVQAGDFDITPTSVPFATVGAMYEEELGTRGGLPPLSWRIFGPPLPNGLEFEVAEVDGQERLRFRGTPVAATAVTVLVTVTDSQGRRAEAPVTLEVREPVETQMPPVMTDGGCTAAGGAELVALALFGLVGLMRRRR